MPTLANITIVDRAGTPVSHVFKPVDLNNGTGYLAEDRADGSAIGQNLLQAESKVQPSKRIKSTAKLTFPKTVVETVNSVSVNKVVDTTYITITCDYGSQFTAAERDALLGAAMKLCDTVANQPVLNKVMVGNERFYG